MGRWLKGVGRTLVEKLVLFAVATLPRRRIAYSIDCMAISGTPRFQGLRRRNSKDRSCQATGANALVKTSILGSKLFEEGYHRVVLVIRAVKEV